MISRDRARCFLGSAPLSQVASVLVLVRWHLYRYRRPSTSPPPGEGTAGETEPSRTTSGESGACPALTLSVQSDTFVSNAEVGCKGGSCTDWTFTGVTAHDIRSAGTVDSIVLLGFLSLDAVQVTAATLRLRVGGALSNEAGLVELHVLESLSVWDDNGDSGAVQGQPTWNRAAGGVRAESGPSGSDRVRRSWSRTTPVRCHRWGSRSRTLTPRGGGS